MYLSIEKPDVAAMFRPTCPAQILEALSRNVKEQSLKTGQGEQAGASLALQGIWSAPYPGERRRQLSSAQPITAVI